MLIAEGEEQRRGLGSQESGRVRVWLTFIDDAGSYRRERDDAFNRQFPYYVKACVLVPADAWRHLADARRALARKHIGSDLYELKWQHLWKLKRRDQGGGSIRLQRSEQFLEELKYHSARDYIDGMLGLLPQCGAKVICTVTPNCVFKDRVEEVAMERMHLQDIMQRIEMEMESQEGFSLLFSDMMSCSDDEADLAAAYHGLYRDGDFIEQYRHICDSIAFLSSKQSCGIQLADFVAGAVNGYLRGYRFSEEIFALRIYARLRKGRDNAPLGYGIVQVPKRKENLRHLEERFHADFAKAQITDETEIPF